MLDQPVPNPLAKNPNVHTHKVFATVGLILIGTIIAIAGIWWYVQGSYQGSLSSNDDSDSAISKTSTSSGKKSSVSAKKATDSAAYTKEEVKGWKTFSSTKWGFEVKYPEDWNGDIRDTDYGAILSNTPKDKPVKPIYYDAEFFFNEDAERKALYDRINSYEVNKAVEVERIQTGLPGGDVKTKDIYTRLPNGKIGGIETLRYKVAIAYGVNNSYYVLFIRNNKAQQIGSHYGYTVEEKIALIDAMVETLKFK